MLESWRRELAGSLGFSAFSICCSVGASTLSSGSSTIGFLWKYWSKTESGGFSPAWFLLRAARLSHTAPWTEAHSPNSDTRNLFSSSTSSFLFFYRLCLPHTCLCHASPKTKSVCQLDIHCSQGRRNSKTGPRRSPGGPRCGGVSTGLEGGAI